MCRADTPHNRVGDSYYEVIGAIPATDAVGFGRREPGLREGADRGRGRCSEFSGRVV